MKRVISAAALSMLCGAAIADDGKSPSDISACMRNTLPAGASVRDVTLDTVDKEGVNKVVKLRTLWAPTAAGQTRVNLRLIEPQLLVGSSYLVLESTPADDIYIFLPFMATVTHNKGGDMKTPLWGTGVSYAELKQVQGLMETSSATRKPDSTVNGRAVYVVDSKTSLDDTGYRRITSYVDQASCLLLRTEFSIDGSSTRKELDADTATLSQSGGRWTLGRVTLRTPSENSHTTVTMGATTPVANPPEALFDPQNFFRAPMP